MIGILNVKRKLDVVAAALDLFCQNICPSTDSPHAGRFKVREIVADSVLLEAVTIIKMGVKTGHLLVNPVHACGFPALEVAESLSPPAGNSFNYS